MHGARSVFPFKSEVARKVLLAINVARESFFHVDDKLTIKELLNEPSLSCGSSVVRGVRVGAF